ncbi:MAG: helix-turn-helix transcriptional regulator [Cyanobacteria bacterium J06638_28]
MQQCVEQAKQWLKQSKSAIAAIALQCGFNSQSHFSKHFRAKIGTTPSQYRRN